LILGLVGLALLAASPARTAGPAEWGSCNISTGDSRRIEACTRIIQNVRETQQKRAGAFWLRGTGYVGKGDFDRAIADFTEAIRLEHDPTELSFFFGSRGSSYEEKGDHDRAIADYTEWIRLDPHNSAAVYSRGDVYKKKGDYDRAIADYTEAIRIDPRRAASFVNRGSCYNLKGEYDRAIADLDEAIRRDRRFPGGNLHAGCASPRR
jgi:tetratricopeptide (TPR) repeat protein